MGLKEGEKWGVDVVAVREEGYWYWWVLGVRGIGGRVWWGIDFEFDGHERGLISIMHRRKK